MLITIYLKIKTIKNDKIRTKASREQRNCSKDVFKRFNCKNKLNYGNQVYQIKFSTYFKTLYVYSMIV